MKKQKYVRWLCLRITTLHLGDFKNGETLRTEHAMFEDR